VDRISQRARSTGCAGVVVLPRPSDPKAGGRRHGRQLGQIQIATVGADKFTGEMRGSKLARRRTCVGGLQEELRGPCSSIRGKRSSAGRRAGDCLVAKGGGAAVGVSSVAAIVCGVPLPDSGPGRPLRASGNHDWLMELSLIRG
jgi:hypothetical protein